MENNFQENKVDDVFSSFDNKEKISQEPIVGHESVIDKEDQILGKSENIKKSNMGFFVILGVIIALGVLAVFIILK